MLVRVNLDLGGNRLVNAALESLATAPASPAPQRIYYDSVLGYARLWNGTTWISVGATEADTLDAQHGTYYLARANHTGTQAAATISDLATVVKTYKLSDFAVPTAAVPMNGQLITGLADPVSAQDAATRAYVIAQIAALVNSAPATLDTLAELSAALGADANFATTTATNIANAKARANHTGTQLAATISDLTTAVDARQSAWGYAATIGDNAALTYTVTHNLATRDVAVSIYEVAAPYNEIYADVQRATTATITVGFGAAPTLSQYRVLVNRVF